MKAKELRVGNLVEYNDLIMSVWSIGNNSTPKKESYYVDLDSKGHDRHLKGIEIEEISPVKLTEEILVKLGGVLFKEDEYFHGRFCLKYLHGHEYWHVTDMETHSYISKVEFIHEWQNVVHAINGQELTINE